MQRASLAKLYVLTEALRSPLSFDTLQSVVTGQQSPLEWPVRVEPAMARAVDLAVGDRLAKWTQLSGRIGVELTSAGVSAAKALNNMEDTLMEERGFLEGVAPKVSESFVTRLISNKRLL